MSNERRRGIIVAVMFMAAFFSAAAYGTFSVFFTPLLGYLRISRAQLSLVPAGIMVGAFICAPGVGWLLDRADARWVVGTGLALTGAASILSAKAQSFGFLALTAALAALGFALVSAVPIATLCTNWFSEHRGFAMGLIWGGGTLGNSALLQFVHYVIAHAGWRWAYMAQGIPLLVTMPLALWVIRSHPAGAAGGSRPARASAALPGLEVEQGIRSRSFWMLGICYFIYALPEGALMVHGVPQLLSLGLSAERAVTMMSVAFFINAISKPLFGALGDGIGPRPALLMTLAFFAVGLLALTKASAPIFLAVFVLAHGFSGGPFALIPMLGAEIYGLKRYGTLWGLTTVFWAVGLLIGPELAGGAYDRYSTYAPAWILYAVLLAIGAILPFACTSFAPEQSAAPLAQASSV